ncbi:MAG: hypothetical protein FWF57_08625 [Defluviitaleaceae bacterium]|nr:hypothetical protein [Defluviitaleaceae bacterium]
MEYVHPEMTIEHALSLHPAIADILLEYGLPCTVCHYKGQDTIGNLDKLYNHVNVYDVINEMNELLEYFNNSEKQ